MAKPQFPNRIELTAYMLPQVPEGEPAPRLLDACTQFVHDVTARVAKERGYSLTVCDLTPREEGPVVANLDKRLPWDDGWFRGIISSDTLEHIEEPANALREFARVTEPGGFLILHIPVTIRGNGEFQANSYRPKGNPCHGHVWALGTDVLDMAVASGYKHVATFQSWDDYRCRVGVMWLLERQR